MDTLKVWFLREEFVPYHSCTQQEGIDLALCGHCYALAAIGEEGCIRVASGNY